MNSHWKILSVTNDKILGESGGGHNQKGVDFQRYWTIQRMIELEESGAEDYLILIEAIQDVAEFDNPISPSSVTLYQVKKKDRKEWTWNELTKIKKPTNRSKANTDGFAKSPIGKIYATMIALDDFSVDGKFVSNRGCDIPLDGGLNAATSVSASFDSLPCDDKKLLVEAMKGLHPDADPHSVLPELYMEKVAIPVDDPRTHLVGAAHQFLEKRSPAHAGQASSFIDALMAIIGPLGAKTDSCASFNELCKQHGYTRTQFLGAIGDLESIPDLKQQVDMWIEKLANEGLGILMITAVKTEVSAILRRNIMGQSEPEPGLVDDCDNFLSVNPITIDISPVLEKGYEFMEEKYKGLKKSQIYAQLIVRAIKCVDQT